MKTLGGIHLLPIVLIAVLSSCTAKPQQIVYGTDGCHFCRMTIVDQQHAAQIVTTKGKAFKFDAIECMVNHLKEVDANSIAMYLCNYYTEPGKLMDATEATFLISDGIPSPMGEFLTAFDTKTDAELEKSKHGGNLFTWDELLIELNQ
ncbi:nitrous oxide reductase accessory protein NosL [Flagellimonas sp. S3867]|uniref:nitrous oxide reductase accessory protein NosL n=1 Tax=Flagellimonas sp. S3867 TaxID=2768063 RepID=UPI001684A04B|nr:nitrous oxide reductase accessory protein NosL [Flagellimonas sp. S3867]